MTMKCGRSFGPPGFFRRAAVGCRSWHPLRNYFGSIVRLTTVVNLIGISLTMCMFPGFYVNLAMIKLTFCDLWLQSAKREISFFAAFARMKACATAALLQVFSSAWGQKSKRIGHFEDTSKCMRDFKIGNSCCDLRRNDFNREY